jgi:hypothetical protein
MVEINMNNTKIKLWQILPTVVIAFIAGYFFKWLTKDHSITDAETAIWLAALGTICAIVGAFVLGERQIHAFLKTSAATGEQQADKKRASILAMADTAHNAMERLSETYRDTRDDRLRIRAVYHGDTFASLIEMLSAIPIHELGSVQVAVALAGLKKNMTEAQYLIDRFIEAKHKAGRDVLFPETIEAVDLRGCKTHAELHYRALVQALKPS